MQASFPTHAQLEAARVSVSRSEEMNRYLYTPPTGQEPYPLVVFLHGGGESGDSLALVKQHGLPKLIAAGREFPFYVLAPQNPYPQGFWDDRTVDRMVDDLVDSLAIDTTRIYLVGLSRGGYGVWRMAINNPDKYAAMIAICPASIPVPYLRQVASLPVWLFHGEQDEVVPVQQTVAAYEVLQALNPEVKLTLYPQAGHDSWTQTFENDQIYEWLLSYQSGE